MEHVDHIQHRRADVIDYETTAVDGSPTHLLVGARGLLMGLDEGHFGIVDKFTDVCEGERELERCWVLVVVRTCLLLNHSKGSGDEVVELD